MKVQTVLYYRYLMRQTAIMCVVSLILSLIVCFVFLFTNILSKQTSYIVASLIWLLPIYAFIVFIIWFLKYKKSKAKLNNLELFERITNAAVRERILKSGARMKYLIPKKDQEIKFFEVINPEIEKQKKLLSILKGKNK